MKSSIPSKAVSYWQPLLTASLFVFFCIAWQPATNAQVTSGGGPEFSVYGGSTGLFMWQPPIVNRNSQATLVNESGEVFFVYVCSLSGGREEPIGMVDDMSSIAIPFANDPKSGVPGFVLKVEKLSGERFFFSFIIFD